MQKFAEFIADDYDPSRRDPSTHHIDGTPKTPEETKLFNKDVAKLKKRDKQKARRARARKQANEYGSTYR
jgi:hypothetical protein